VAVISKKERGNRGKALLKPFRRPATKKI